MMSLNGTESLQTFTDFGFNSQGICTHDNAFFRYLDFLFSNNYDFLLTTLAYAKLAGS